MREVPLRCADLRALPSPSATSKVILRIFPRNSASHVASGVPCVHRSPYFCSDAVRSHFLTVRAPLGGIHIRPAAQQQLQRHHHLHHQQHRAALPRSLDVLAMFISRRYRPNKWPFWGLVGFEFPLTVVLLALFGIAAPNLYRTKLWADGAANGFNSSPTTGLYAAANYRPYNPPKVWSQLCVDSYSLAQTGRPVVLTNLFQHHKLQPRHLSLLNVPHARQNSNVHPPCLPAPSLRPHPHRTRCPLFRVDRIPGRLRHE